VRFSFCIQPVTFYQVPHLLELGPHTCLGCLPTPPGSHLPGEPPVFRGRFSPGGDCSTIPGRMTTTHLTDYCRAVTRDSFLYTGRTLLTTILAAGGGHQPGRSSVRRACWSHFACREKYFLHKCPSSIPTHDRSHDVPGGYTVTWGGGLRCLLPTIPLHKYHCHRYLQEASYRRWPGIPAGGATSAACCHSLGSTRHTAPVRHHLCITRIFTALRSRVVPLGDAYPPRFSRVTTAIFSTTVSVRHHYVHYTPRTSLTIHSFWILVDLTTCTWDTSSFTSAFHASSLLSLEISRILPTRRFLGSYFCHAFHTDT